MKLILLLLVTCNAFFLGFGGETITEPNVDLKTVVENVTTTTPFYYESELTDSKYEYNDITNATNTVHEESNNSSGLNTDFGNLTDAVREKVEDVNSKEANDTAVIRAEVQADENNKTDTSHTETPPEVNLLQDTVKLVEAISKNIVASLIKRSPKLESDSEDTEILTEKTTKLNREKTSSKEKDVKYAEENSYDKANENYIAETTTEALNDFNTELLQDASIPNRSVEVTEVPTVNTYVADVDEKIHSSEEDSDVNPERSGHPDSEEHYEYHASEHDSPHERRAYPGHYQNYGQDHIGSSYGYPDLGHVFGQGLQTTNNYYGGANKWNPESKYYNSPSNLYSELFPKKKAVYEPSYALDPFKAIRNLIPGYTNRRSNSEFPELKYDVHSLHSNAYPYSPNVDDQERNGFTAYQTEDNYQPVSRFPNYFQNFNPPSANIFGHRYRRNIGGPYSFPKYN